MRDLNKLMADLPEIEADYDIKADKFIMAKPHAFIRDNGLYINLCAGDFAGDYYGERGSWINQKLEQWAKNMGAYWEWYDAETIVLAD